MPLLPGCPDWDYATHPDRAAVVPLRTEFLLKRLRRGLLDGRATVRDTRSVHQYLFSGLTPAGFGYYVGHYRGEAFRCLTEYEVFIASDPLVGCPPARVFAEMTQLARHIDTEMGALDLAQAIPNGQVSAADKVLYAVAVAARIFADFLTIHPYANGNGHVARFCVWAILGRYGIWPRHWTVEPAPPTPPYTQLIGRYRRGDREPLESAILAACG